MKVIDRTIRTLCIPRFVPSHTSLPKDLFSPPFPTSNPLCEDRFFFHFNFCCPRTWFLIHSLSYIRCQYCTSSGFVHWSSGRMICFIVKSEALFRRNSLRSCSSMGRRFMASATSGWSSIIKSSLRRPRIYNRESDKLKLIPVYLMFSWLHNNLFPFTFQATYFPWGNLEPTLYLSSLLIFWISSNAILPRLSE